MITMGRSLISAANDFSAPATHNADTRPVPSDSDVLKTACIQLSSLNFVPDMILVNPRDHHSMRQRWKAKRMVARLYWRN